MRPCLSSPVKPPCSRWWINSPGSSFASRGLIVTQNVEALAASANTLAAFFDGDTSVMVMADDMAIRRNRLNLLAVLGNQAGVLADFAAISG